MVNQIGHRDISILHHELDMVRHKPIDIRVIRLVITRHILLQLLIVIFPSTYCLATTRRDISIYIEYAEYVDRNITMAI